MFNGDTQISLRGFDEVFHLLVHNDGYKDVPNTWNLNPLGLVSLAPRERSNMIDGVEL